MPEKEKRGRRERERGGKRREREGERIERREKERDRGKRSHNEMKAQGADFRLLPSIFFFGVSDYPDPKWPPARFDRILSRSSTWTPASIQLLGGEKIPGNFLHSTFVV